MTTADGGFDSLTQIVSSGAPANRWNLVLLSDGYQVGELPAYRRHAEEFVDFLFATPPFDALRRVVNVFRADYWSTDSGCDDPRTCADGSTGSGAAPRTYFDATLCSGGMRRLLTVSSATALAQARARVPEVTRVLVLVNTDLYGGSGGNPVGVASARFAPAATAYGVAVHELGHTAFDLADEYGGCTPGAANRYTGAEPLAANVTIETDRARLKWRDLVAAGTALPTQAVPDCRNCAALPPSPVAAGTVGLFEEAMYQRCGIYRPEYDCLMRSIGLPFCAVCRRRITEVLTPFDAPEPRSALRVVEVSAPGINTWFDPSGTVVVTDTAPALDLVGTGGGGVLQSRLIPRAPAGTGAAGLFPYEYRVSLTGVTGTAGVQRVEVDVGPIRALDYAGTGAAPVYEVTRGGVGDVRLTSAEQTAAGRLVLTFSPPVPAGSTGYFVGFVSEHPPRAGTARVVDTAGRLYDVEARVPAVP